MPWHADTFFNSRGAAWRIHSTKDPGWMAVRWRRPRPEITHDLFKDLLEDLAWGEAYDIVVDDDLKRVALAAVRTTLDDIEEAVCDRHKKNKKARIPVPRRRRRQ